mmetsp:Transcript_20509/g.40321  ORF Transcript_20509/g.40321 Transcript_20509/m.40321 type:complete len:339 (+) Transcript_20509:92-1108(+)
MSAVFEAGFLSRVAFSAFFALFSVDIWLHGPAQGVAKHVALAISALAALAGRYELYILAQLAWLVALAVSEASAIASKAELTKPASKPVSKSVPEKSKVTLEKDVLPKAGLERIEHSLKQFAKNLDADHTCDGKPWQLEQDRDGIKVFSAEFPGQSTKRWKVTCTCRAESLQELEAELMDFDRRVGAKGWDTALKEGSIVKSFGEHFTIARMVTNAAAGGAISSREFFDLRVKYHGSTQHHLAPDNGSISATVGLDPKKDKTWLANVLKPDKTYVLGTSHPGGGMRITSLGDNTFKYEMVNNMNLNGWIPTSVINSATSSALLESHQAMLAHLRKKFA